MADNDYDPAGSTQMFRAFVDDGADGPGPTGGSSRSTGLIATVVVVAVVVVAAVAFFALK